MLRWISWLLAFACVPALAAEECYTAESGEVSFHVMQSGAPYTGKFTRFSGDLCFTQGRLTRIVASLDPASVDTGLPELDAALKEKDFFAVRDHPKVTFSGSATKSQVDSQTVRGTLEIKGNKREVEVVLHTKPSGDRMTVSGSLTLDRLQYGIGMGDWTNTKWLGAEVKLDINAALTRRK